MKLLHSAFALKYISIGLSILSGVLVWLFGEPTSIFKVLIALLVVDYFTGVIKAICKKNISSEKGANGIKKKFGLLAIIILANMIARITNYIIPLREICITFYIINEGFSITENVAEMGVPVPNVIIKILEQLNNENKEEQKNEQKKYRRK